MTMQFTGSLHAEGWWDHMPPGHRVDRVMNPGHLSSSPDGIALDPALRASSRPTPEFVSERIVQTDQKVRTSSRRLKRTHVSAWILVAAVGATGGALAVAAIRDPQSMRQHLDSTLAEVKSLTGSSSTSSIVTAQATAPEATPASTPVPEPARVTEAVAPAQSRSFEAPLPPIAPAAGPSVSTTPLPAPAIKHLAPPAESMSKELAETSQVMPSLPAPPPLAPLQPLTVEPQPTVQTPPAVVTPLTVPQSDEVAPPPVQTPASSAQR